MRVMLETININTKMIIYFSYFLSCQLSELIVGEVEGLEVVFLFFETFKQELDRIIT